MAIVDLHCDTILRLCEGGHLKDMKNAHINIEKLKRGGCMAQCFAIFVPSNDAAVRHGISEEPSEFFERAYLTYLRELEVNADSILPAYTVSDVEQNYANGKMSAILTVEDGVTINGKLENIDDYFVRGIRMVSLTWNYENSLGYPQSSDLVLHARGLKPFGKDAVRRMNELGIAVDVSHLSEGGFWDVVDVSTKPFIASHSCARALCSHSRNLTDEQLKALANKGGVCGINYMAGFLHERVGGEMDRYSTINEVITHLRHMANVAGVDTLALGSDYDGIRSILEWKDYAGTPMLISAMEREFTGNEIEKICYKNALRAFRDIIGN